jgi:protein-S-isoprenylcysteine O-methyltransferase Ste14
MREETRASDPRSAWKAQPEEKSAVNIEQIVSRRTAELHSRTRSETLASIGAAVLFAGIAALRLAPLPSRMVEIGLAAILAWVAITLYWFRQRIARSGASRADAVADPGLDYYRKELEKRRDHLRNIWLWNGPLLLACVVLFAVLSGKWFAGPERLPSVLPLLLLLAAWVGYGAWRRRRQAGELQREIDELGRQ